MVEYCVQVKHDAATASVDTFLDTCQVDMPMQWKSVSNGNCAVRMNSSFLKSLIVNPKIFLNFDVPTDWSSVWLLALYNGEEFGQQEKTTNKSIWYSEHNSTAFAIVCKSPRMAATNPIESLQLRASKSKLVYGDRQKIGILPVIPEVVRFEPRRLCATMAKFLDMPDKVQNFATRCTLSGLTSPFQNGGKKQNVCQTVRVNKFGDQISIDNPERELEADTWMHMRNVRMLEPSEQVASDFSRSETLSTILEKISCKKDKINSIDIDNVIKAAQMFSSPEHTVQADKEFSEAVVVHKVKVDVDSVSATFNHRKSSTPPTISNVFDVLKNFCGEKDSNFCHNTTSYSPNSKELKAYPSNGFRDKKTNRRIKCCGPTIEIHPDGGYSRMQLQTPIGSEVLKIWIYAPDTSFRTTSFEEEVRTVANQCAKGLAAIYHSVFESTLTNAIEEGVRGYKAFDIPGGYMFPLSIALLFLEKHKECSFLLETYNCKKKGLEFVMEAKEIGTESWFKKLTSEMKTVLKESPNLMLKMFCRLDRIAQVQPDRSKIGFGFQIQYRDSSGNTLYSLCKPAPDKCNSVMEFPMAFLPSDLASRLSFLKSGARIQSYIPLWNEANFKRNKQDRKQKSNLGLKHCMDKDHSGGLILNVTEVLRGAKEEHKMIDSICRRFPTDFCERVEIAVPWKLGTIQSDGPLCYVDDKRPSDNRWLDLRTMLSECYACIKNNTLFWPIGPIAEYMSLNFAAALAVYHTSARGMADTSLLPLERDQLCQNMVYMNHLLRIAKDGKSWQKKFQDKLCVLTRSVKRGREMMLPPVPGRVFSILAATGGCSITQIPTVQPVAPNLVITCSSMTAMIDSRILENSTLKNNFGQRVLRCRTCNRGFYGGKGTNDTQLYVEHFKQFPSHATGPTSSKKKMANKDWKSDYNALLETAERRYDSMYNDSQKRGYDVVMKEQKNVLLLGVAGAGKSTLVQDLLPLLRCLFWKKDEIQVCGPTHAVAQRTDNAASTFHSVMGIRCDDGDDGNWNFSVEACLEKMAQRKDFLNKVRVVIMEEGLEVPSNYMEAYFRYITVNCLNIITILNGDCCQGAYREDEETGKKETCFFANPNKLAQWCPTLEIVTFTEDQRTKNVALKRFKTEVRNAQTTLATQQFVTSNQYTLGETDVDIVLCARITQMNQHNLMGLGRNKNAMQTYYAQSTNSAASRLTYKKHGINHVLQLKRGAPVMIMQHFKTTCGKILRNGTLGTVTELTEHSVHIEVMSNNGLTTQVFEIKRVRIERTDWQQLPLHQAYAGTIAKCIGFEFESIAIDFGIKDVSDCQAPWRQKQAYTAITRAKQKCYFIGPAPMELLNNMDMNALAFFNRRTQTNQKQPQEMHVVRNVYEMREFWVRYLVSRSNKRARDSNCQENDLKMFREDAVQLPHTITGKTVADNKDITVYANMYPCCEQIIFGKGHILAATSQYYKQLLLKRYEKADAVPKNKHEIGILNTCKDVLGVLKLVATVDKGIVLERMANKVSWKHFANQSTLEVKHAFCKNLSDVADALRKNKIAHGNISNKTAWVDMIGNVKLAWFQDAQCPATEESMNKDRADVEKLQRSLFPIADLGGSGSHNSDTDLEDGNSVDFGRHSSDSSSILSICGDDEAYGNSDCIHDAANKAPLNSKPVAWHDIADCPNSSGHLEECCSSKCVTFLGNLQCTDKVDSPINWLVDACVEIELISTALQMKYEDEPAQVIAHWNRDVKHTTGNRHRTGGGITDADFWPDILTKIARKKIDPPSSTQMVFTDFGSEFFLQGLLCAMLGDFKEVVGIEIDPDTFDKSVKLSNLLMTRAQRENKFISKIELHQGDFLKHQAVPTIMARSTVVYANNVVFGSDSNVALVTMWRQHLPANATVVMFDETAILSSGSQRISRLSLQLNWISKIAMVNASVSWHPSDQKEVHVWQVLPEYTSLRGWAASAKFVDLLGWAIFHGKAFLIDGAKRSSLWPEHFTVFDFSAFKSQWKSVMQRDESSIFVVVKSTHEDYILARNQASMKLQDPTNRANLNSFCVVDCSEHHPVLNTLLREILKRQD